MDKALQRKIAKVNISSISQEDKQLFSEKICEYLKMIVKEDKCLSYYPLLSEADVRLFNSAKITGLPVIKSDGLMSFYLYEEDKLKKNFYDIYEPDISVSEKIEVSDYHYVIVPMLGFDRYLNRLGRGNGYYDRFLRNHKLIKIGVGFECQKFDEIIHNENDIAMDYIVTEKGIYLK